MTSYIEIPATLGLKGRYKLQRRKAEYLADGKTRFAGAVIEESAWSDNLITNAGKNAIMTLASGGANMFFHCVVGTGNTAPAESNTSLASYLGYFDFVQAASTTRNSTVAPYYVKHSATFRFKPGSATGNVAEVGMVLTSSASAAINASTTLHSRALIVDGVGSPTTVTVAADEYLDVTWELFIYPTDEGTGSFNMTIDGVVTAFNYTVRPCELDATGSPGENVAGPMFAGVGISVGSEPSTRGFVSLSVVEPVIASVNYGTYATTFPISTVQGHPTPRATNVAASDAPNTFAAAAYTNGNYYRDYTAQWSLNNGNMNIKSIVFWLRAVSYQLELNNVVAKINTKVFTITVRLSIANVP